MNSDPLHLTLDELFNLTLGMSLEATTVATEHFGRGKRFFVLTFMNTDGEEAVVALGMPPARGPQFYRIGTKINLPDFMNAIIAAAGRDRNVGVVNNVTADELWECLATYDSPRARIAFLYAVGQISTETAAELMRDPKNRVLSETVAGDWEIDYDFTKPARSKRKAAAAPVATAPVAPPKPKTERDNPAWGLL